MGGVRWRQRSRKGKREHRDERDGRCCGCCTLAHWWHLDNARAGPEDAAENGRCVQAAKRANARLFEANRPRGATVRNTTTPNDEHNDRRRAAAVIAGKRCRRISDGGKAANAINARNAVAPAWPTVAGAIKQTLSYG
jgi:hypothetical protein